MKTIITNHDKISPTAKLVAYWRQYTDIPFAKDVASLFNVDETLEKIFPKDFNQLNGFFTPYVEIRYKCINNFILKHNITQVLEFASGISLRGLAMTQDPNLIYVESDLPGLTNEKKELIQEVMKRNSISERKNLFLCTANILNEDEVQSLLKHFDPKKPLLVVHEGLFQYFSSEEKAEAAKNIHKILTCFGGYWITPDFETKTQSHYSFVHTALFQSFMKILVELTGRDLSKISFDSEEEVYRFFNELGFSVEVLPQVDPAMVITALDGKNMSAEGRESIDKLRLWVMKILFKMAS